MTEPAISVRNLGKEYLIGGQEARSDNFREALSSALTAPFKRLRQLRGADTEQERFWALQDINFDIQPGEVVGIIGHNGAGKSTLLKTLCRITEPTTGEIRIRGRVASLLEVGTGFHPELTGRENIFLNGAILGMTRKEIQSKFDEIVDFAEVEKFLDTPVKRYSSGMYIRLAFSVAAHLEPEILLVDEVLAVGDAAFQKRALGQMENVAKSGRTVLFVTHNLSAAARICSRSILLDHGLVAADGFTHDVIANYMSKHSKLRSASDWQGIENAPGGEECRLLSVTSVSTKGILTDNLDIKNDLRIDIRFEVIKPNFDIQPALGFFNEENLMLFAAVDMEFNLGNEPGIYTSSCLIPGNFFAEGRISITAELSTKQPKYKSVALAESALVIEIFDDGSPGSVRGTWERPIPGVVRPKLDWKHKIAH